MMYMMTEQEHAQIVEAMTLAYPNDRSRLPSYVATLAMLKAMKPVSPQCYGLYVEHYGQLVLQFPVQGTKEACESDSLMYAKSSRYEVRSFYTPTKD